MPYFNYDQVAELKRMQNQLARYQRILFFLIDNGAIEGWGGIDKDAHMIAWEVAQEAGREESNRDDEREGAMRLIEQAMKLAGTGGENGNDR